MVIADNGLPEPDNPNEELRVSNEGVILVTDDDSDQEPGGREYGQYQPLPSSPIEESTDTSDEDRENEVVSSSDSHSASSAFLPITPAEEILVKEVWSGPPPKSSDIEMNSEKIDIVKEAMANITLPPGSIPEWAASIPEEDWRQQLFKRLEDMREKRT